MLGLARLSPSLFKNEGYFFHCSPDNDWVVVKKLITEKYINELLKSQPNTQREFNLITDLSINNLVKDLSW